MTDYNRIAIDTSKSVFTLHGVDGQDRPVLRPARAGLIWRDSSRSCRRPKWCWKLAAVRIIGAALCKRWAMAYG